jgi:thioesterase domain-containing protein
VVSPEDGRGEPPAIGRPTANVKAYVLDEQRQPLPVGEAGELYLGGEQVARGYVGRPELTRERFLADPFVASPTARMYRTGDWVRWLPDGELEFLGRNDDQVQIRGYRVELGEVEERLFAHGSLQQVCCLPRLLAGIPSSIVAHIVPRQHGSDLSGELKSYLKAYLPCYMVPSEFVIHAQLPLTPQGKIDRAIMKGWQPLKIDPSARAPVGDELEDALASLWNSLLPAARNSPPTDTFTQLGGDSLQAIRLLLGVEEITRQPLGLSTFFLKPTFAGLCEAVRSRKVKPAFDPVLVLRKQGVRQPLFCLYALDGDVAAYFELAEALGDDQPVIGIRSPGLADLSRLPKTMEAAAAEVVRLIRSVHPRGCPALVGFSWAGLLAFEVARQLQETEGISGFTCLIGPAVPLRRTNPVHRLSHFVRFFPSWAWQIIQDRRNAASRFQKILKRLSILTSQKRAVASLDQPEWANSPVSRQLMDLAIAYHPQVKSSVLLNIFREREDFIAQSHPLKPSDTSYLPDGGWRRWTRNRPNVHWLDQGKHMLILKKPYVSKLARSIRSAMDEHFLRIAKTPTIPGTHCLR